MIEINPNQVDIGKCVRNMPVIIELDEQSRMIDEFDGAVYR